VSAHWSIRTRLILGATLVLVVFLAGAGWAVQRAHADSVLAQHHARLQTTIYLLMAAAELDDTGALQMPAALAEPRLSMPDSGLVALISDHNGRTLWQSAPFSSPASTDAVASPGQWRFDVAPRPTSRAPYSPGTDLRASVTVLWATSAQALTLTFTVLEDKSALDQELAAFDRTLWSWLGTTAVLLLLTQWLVLHQALRPLQRMAQEIRHIEHGDQSRLEGRYPRELDGLGRNLNLLIEQERARQTRFRQALDDLAHSLKTPLAVLRASLEQPDELATQVRQQVQRMDDIVVHQLGRAGADGAARFTPALLLQPILQRVTESLRKVHADKPLNWQLDCDQTLSWRITEANAFEMLGNLLDNAAKWARDRVQVRLWLEDGQLHLRVMDNGPGFKDPSQVGQRRVRQDEQVPGHGIGLAVVRDLVEGLGGHLEFSRAALGGAQVDVVFPA